MTRPILFLAVLGCCGYAASDPVRQISGPAQGNVIPGFNQGRYYWNLEPGDGQTTVYGADGLPAFTYQVTNGARIQGLGFDADGAAAVAWWSPDGSGIDLVNTTGSLTRTLKTGLFMPGHCGFAEDHSLWCTGTQLVHLGSQTAPAKGDYMAVRHYLQNGTEAGAYLPRSAFPMPGLPPDYWGWQRRVITVTHDRIGLWLISGKSSSQTEWVELDLKGNLLGRWKLDQLDGRLQVAMTADDHVYLQRRYRTMYLLDRASSTWKPVNGPVNPHAWMTGAAGNQLVFLGYWPDQSVHFYWYDQPQP